MVLCLATITCLCLEDHMNGLVLSHNYMSVLGGSHEWSCA